MSLSDRAGLAPDETAERSGGVEARTMSVGGQELMVAVKRGSDSRPPLLLFNGIGANWQLARPFLEALTETTAIIFDMPGIGGSPLPKRPYRPSSVAQLGARLVSDLGYDKVDVAGVSWGGGIAQQFAYQYPQLCRRLVLAATSPGAIMVPGSPQAILRMATPRRYLDKNYMHKIAPDLYGGAFRKDPSLIGRHAEAMFGARGMGYVYQLLAMVGWTSLPWLRAVRQPTLILMGRDDPLVPVVNGHILARLIPNARLEVIDDGHLFIVARPQETARRIEQFLEAGP
jgi:poly(3-hydroxyalkanoate) depolymerase